jgi:chromosome segregation ATPase
MLAVFAACAGRRVKAAPFPLVKSSIFQGWRPDPTFEPCKRSSGVLRLTAQEEAISAGHVRSTSQEKRRMKAVTAAVTGALIATLAIPGAWAQEVKQDLKDLKEDRREIRQDKKEIRQDRRELRKDRRELRKDIKEGNKEDVKADLKEIKEDKKELREDKKDLRDDRRDLRKDRRELKRDVHQKRQGN